MNTRLVSYLRHLGTLSLALGCAGAVQATNPDDAITETQRDSVERLVAQAETPGSASGDFSVWLPWYYRAWPESTWRNFHGFQPELSRSDPASAPVENLASLLEEIKTQA